MFVNSAWSFKYFWYKFVIAVLNKGVRNGSSFSYYAYQSNWMLDRASALKIKLTQRTQHTVTLYVYPVLGAWACGRR